MRQEGCSVVVGVGRRGTKWNKAKTMIRLNLLMPHSLYLFSFLRHPSINGHHNKIARLQTIFNAKDPTTAPHYGSMIHHLSHIVVIQMNNVVLYTGEL